MAQLAGAVKSRLTGRKLRQEVNRQRSEKTQEEADYKILLDIAGQKVSLSNVVSGRSDMQKDCRLQRRLTKRKKEEDYLYMRAKEHR